MYVAWSTSPALNVVFSLSADWPTLARQAFKRSNHGPVAASFESILSWEGFAGALGRAAMARAPTSDTARRRIAGDLTAERASAAKVCSEPAVTLCTTDRGAAILPWRRVTGGTGSRSLADAARSACQDIPT